MSHHDRAHYAIAMMLITGLVLVAAAWRHDHEHLAALTALQNARDAAGFASFATKAPKGSWRALTQDEVIALGEALKSKGEHKVVIFCNAPTCRGLQRDIDDALQIAGWDGTFEASSFGTEEDGIMVGPPGEAADAIVAALPAALQPRVVVPMTLPAGTVGIIIGRAPR